MRHAGNFNPEWGYLAPAPSFLRTARVVVVAAVIGATAGAAVVFSLVDRPAAEESVAARTLVQPVASAFVPTVTQLQAEELQASPPQPVALSGARGQPAKPRAANAHAVTSGASESSTPSATQHPASAAVLAEAPALTDIPPALAATDTALAPDGTPAQKKAAKKPRYTWRNVPRSDQGARWPLALLRPLGARTQNGGEY
jgi:hypothetical protein